MQAAIVLTKHMGLSRLHRMAAAFAMMDKLAYTGNPQQFQSEFMSVKREMDNCQVTIVHWTIYKLTE